MTFHPLNPLSPQELELAVKITREERRLPDTFIFITVSLREPPNQSVWKTDYLPLREAEIIMLNTENGECFEAITDLNSKKVKKFLHIKDVQPAYTPSDYEITATCEVQQRGYKFSAVNILTFPVKEALAKRGVYNLDEVMVDLWAGGRGFIGETDNPSVRMVKPILFLKDESDKYAYCYGRPIEGLTPVIDLNRKLVIRVEDLGELTSVQGLIVGKFYVPLRYRELRPKVTESQLRQMEKANRQEVPPLQPLDIVQPQGPSYVVDGYHVKWQGWDFHIGFNAREGLTIHTAQIWDREKSKYRKVLYRASCAEMVVPYGDPNAPTYRRSAFDVGEEGLGFNANSLELGCDCVGVIKYLDGIVNTNKGEARVIKNAICIHEEDYGVLWKHTNWRTGEASTARCRRLIVSFFATVANYDYGFFYNFYQDGSIQFEVKLTGILLTTAIPHNIHSNSELRHATLLHKGLSAPYHHHFFNFRLEMCIEDFQNRVYEINCQQDLESEVNLQGNAFTATKNQIATEYQATRTVNQKTGRFWQIANAKVLNAVEDPVAYRIVPLDNAFSYLQTNSPVMRRAGFMSKHLWVSPFHEDERYPASTYPNKPNFDHSGLPEWNKANRSLIDKSLVVWYNLGVLHIPRLEDWPIMPVVHASFSIMPDGFFNENPTLYLMDESTSKESHCFPKSKL